MYVVLQSLKISPLTLHCCQSIGNVKTFDTSPISEYILIGSTTNIGNDEIYAALYK